MALLLQDGSYLMLQAQGLSSGKLLLKGDPGAVFHTLAPAWRTANFGNGTTAVSWSAPLDPGERKTYSVDASTELNGINDTILSVTATLSGLAILAGLKIYGVTNDDKRVTLWLEILEADRARAAWNPPGETHVITVSIIAMTGQVFERSISLRVVQLV
jgi:hypothetical protein